jgi:hypothetical protein
MGQWRFYDEHMQPSRLPCLHVAQIRLQLQLFGRVGSASVMSFSPLNDSSYPRSCELIPHHDTENHLRGNIVLSLRIQDLSERSPQCKGIFSACSSWFRIGWVTFDRYVRLCPIPQYHSLFCLLDFGVLHVCIADMIHH